MKFEDIHIGQTASIEKAFADTDVMKFAELSLDFNPLHLDEKVAAKSIFQRRIVHGILVSSLISATIGTKLPGEGAIYLGQNLKFTKPVFIGDRIKATVTVTQIREDKRIIYLETKCFNQSDDIVIDGDAVIKMMT